MAEERVAVWETVGPAFETREQIQYGGEGRLGTDYTDGADGRWPDLMIGPKLNTVSCAAVGGTTANANSFALTGGLNATLYGLLGRGTDPALIKISDMSVSDPSISQSERVTDLLYTKNAAGDEEVAICKAGDAYDTLTAVTNATTVTVSTVQTAVIRVMAYGWPGQVIFGAGGQTLKHNELTGAVNMETPSWVTRATITGQPFTPTSIANIGNWVLLGTSNGPYYFDNDFLEFVPLITEIGEDPDNCKQMKAVTFLGGILAPTKKALYLCKPAGSVGVGPEKFRNNGSPVQGRVTAIAPADRGVYVVVKNESTGNSYLCHARPPQSGEPFQDHELVYFPVASLSTVACEFMVDIDTANGTRTNPTLLLGSDSNFAWMTQGRLSVEPDDSNYEHGTAGTWHGTEMWRHPYVDKLPKWVEFKTASCSSTETVQVQLSVNGGAATDVGPVVKKNGVHRVDLPPEVGAKFMGRRVKPSLVLAGAGGNSPKVVGPLLMGYELRNRDPQRMVG